MTAEALVALDRRALRDAPLAALAASGRDLVDGVSDLGRLLAEAVTERSADHP